MFPVKKVKNMRLEILCVTVANANDNGTNVLKLPYQVFQMHCLVFVIV